jgi:hypothetical protein
VGGNCCRRIEDIFILQILRGPIAPRLARDSNSRRGWSRYRGHVCSTRDRSPIVGSSDWKYGAGKPTLVSGRVDTRLPSTNKPANPLGSDHRVARAASPLFVPRCSYADSRSSLDGANSARSKCQTYPSEAGSSASSVCHNWTERRRVNDIFVLENIRNQADSAAAL